MLTLTRDAVEAVRVAKQSLSVSESGGVRISMAPQLLDGAGPAIAFDVVDAPAGEDEVLRGDGAQIFLAPGTARVLEDKVLDAEIASEGEIRFAILDQGDGP